MKKTLLALLICMTAMATTAQSDKPLNAATVGAFAGAYMNLCHAKYQNVIASRGERPDLIEQAQKCVSDAKTDMRGFQKDLSVRLKTSAAQAALKTFVIKVMAALDGLPPSNGERGSAYDVRQAALKDATNEAWESFQMEL